MDRGTVLEQGRGWCTRLEQGDGVGVPDWNRDGVGVPDWNRDGVGVPDWNRDGVGVPDWNRGTGLVFQFDQGQIGTPTPSPCSNLVHQPRPSVPRLTLCR
ncbi:MAG: hypothetical protein FWE96_03145 [Coriobacteriia bacterium]|nr:hypothetical protein [Coriobacteriia bacterium]